MPIVDLTKTDSTVGNKDSVVVPVMLEDIPGGRSLDVSALPATDVNVRAGHVIVKNDTTNEYKALGYTAGGAYDALSGETYVGILYVSVSVEKPLASIMVRGTVNEAAATEYGLPDVPAGAKTALSLIRFTQAY